MEAAREAHVPEVDWLKGFAILCVVAIHAKVYDFTFVHLYIVNRAVPVFLVLLGITTELFFRKHEAEPARERLGRWYRGRVLRLVPPMWAMSAAWLAAVMYFHRAIDLRLGGREALLTFAGYSPWIGTAWFITLVLQLVLLLPALRWLFVVAGPVGVLVPTAVLCGYSVLWTWQLVEFGTTYLGNKVPPPGWFYSWIFPPRFFFHLAAGIYMARYWGGRPDRLVAVLAAAVWLGSTAVVASLPPLPDDFIMGPLRLQMAAYLLDVPLAIALLGFFGLFRRFERALPLRFLAFCGRASWGIYLGHLLVHEVVHLGFRAPETGPQLARLFYAALLLACGIGLAVAGDRLRRAFRRLPA